MQYFELINLIITLVMSTWWLAAYTKVYIKKYEQDAKIDGDYESERGSIQYARDYLRAITYFSVIAGIVLTLGFAFLFILQNESFSDIPVFSTIVSSGLHMPFFLMLYGYIIKKPPRAQC